MALRQYALSNVPAANGSRSRSPATTHGRGPVKRARPRRSMSTEMSTATVRKVEPLQPVRAPARARAEVENQIVG
jgi:hypothetical protein